jgi:hypothetical protein
VSDVMCLRALPILVRRPTRIAQKANVRSTAGTQMLLASKRRLLRPQREFVGPLHPQPLYGACTDPLLALLEAMISITNFLLETSAMFSGECRDVCLA